MDEIRISRYLAAFAGVMIAITLTFIAISTLLPQTSDGGGGGTSAFQLIVAAMVAGQLFAKDHGRVPTKAERKKLVWWSFGVTVLFAIAMVGILGIVGIYMTSAQDVAQLGAGLFAKLPLGLWLAVVAVALALSWLPIWLGYVIASRLFAYKLKKRAQS